MQKTKEIRKNYVVFEDFAEKLTFNHFFLEKPEKEAPFWKIGFSMFKSRVRVLKTLTLALLFPQPPLSKPLARTFHGRPPPCAFLLHPSAIRSPNNPHLHLCKSFITNKSRVRPPPELLHPPMAGTPFLKPSSHAPCASSILSPPSIFNGFFPSPPSILKDFTFSSIRMAL
jgi:hypothetical protein